MRHKKKWKREIRKNIKVIIDQQKQPQDKKNRSKNKSIFKIINKK